MTMSVRGQAGWCWLAAWTPKGVDLVETQFGAAIVPDGQNTIVDLLSRLTFLASLGIRMLISTTRALSRKGSKR